MFALTFAFTSPPCFAIQDVPTTESILIEKKVDVLEAIEIFDFEIVKIANSSGLLTTNFTETKAVAYAFSDGSVSVNETNVVKSHYFDWNDSYLCYICTISV